MSINRVCISGNLTRDPELRSTQSGMVVLSIGVAVNDRRKNPSTGQWEDYPNFIDCTMFGSRSEKLAPYLHKGAKVAIEGKLRYSSWERDGQRRSKIEVIIDDIELLSSSAQGSQGHTYGAQPMAAPPPAPPAYGAQPMAAPPPAPPAHGAQYTPAPPMAPAAPVYDDEVPF